MAEVKLRILPQSPPACVVSLGTPELQTQSLFVLTSFSDLFLRAEWKG